MQMVLYKLSAKIDKVKIVITLASDMFLVSKDLVSDIE